MADPKIASSEVSIPATEAEVVDTALDDLAQQIRYEHDAAKQALVSSLEHMLKCGELLTEARNLVPQGQWNRWAQQEVGLHPKTVRTYIRYFAYKELLIESGVETGSAARRLLAGMELPRSNDSSAMMQEAKRLREDGWSVRDVAQKFGVSDARVSQWCNYEQHKRRDAARQREIQAALKLKRQQDRDRTIKQKSDPIREAYVLLRRAVSIMDQERLEGESPRKAARIIDAMYRVEDMLVDW